jgi:NarL family two-component system response regulator LiaR
MTSPIRVLVVDDHEIVREGLAMLLGDQPEIELVAEATNGEEAVALAAALHPDVVLMDLVMPDMHGIQATRLIRAADSATQVVVLTSFADDQQVYDAIQAGAIGYLLKDVLKPDLLRAIRAAARGTPTLHAEAQRRLMQQVVAPAQHSPIDDLTPRERDVLCLIGQGRSNKEIAAALHLSEGTVKGYVSAVIGKLGVADRTQAALIAVKAGVGSRQSAVGSRR